MKTQRSSEKNQVSTTDGNASIPSPIELDSQQTPTKVKTEKTNKDKTLFDQAGEKLKKGRKKMFRHESTTIAETKALPPVSDIVHDKENRLDSETEKPYNNPSITNLSFQKLNLNSLSAEQQKLCGDATKLLEQLQLLAKQSQSPELANIANQIEETINQLITLTHQQSSELLAGQERFAELESSQRLNNLGLPIHPFEDEVKNMIERANNGEEVLPNYAKGKKQKKYENPIDYIKIELGKYINYFNDGQGDFLYLFHIKQLNLTFYNTLNSYLSRHPEYRGYISTKSEEVEVAVNSLKNIPDKQKAIYRKVHSLITSNKIEL